MKKFLDFKEHFVSIWNCGGVKSEDFVTKWRNIAKGRTKKSNMQKMTSLCA